MPLRRRCRFWLFVVMLALLVAGAAQAREPDWSDYGQLLKRHLSRHTAEGVDLAWVDYSALKKDPLYPHAIAQLEDFDPDQLESRAEKLAFYTNAYNILAIKMVLDHWPVESIKDAGSFFSPVWDKVAGKIGDKTVTLDGIEDGILRQLDEPRVHMAIVCASLSCPDLRPEPYTAARLEEQLEAATRQYLTNPTKGVRVEDGAIRVSKIFAWFKEDFKPSGGVEAFVRRYHPDPLPELPVKANLPYDWSLNGQ